MCLVLYVVSETPLEVVEEKDFSVSEVRGGRSIVRQQLPEKHFYQVQSSQGLCWCTLRDGMPVSAATQSQAVDVRVTGVDDLEGRAEAEQGKRDLQRLVHYLLDSGKSTPVAVYACFDGDQKRPVRSHSKRRLQDLLGTGFALPEQELVTLVLGD